MQLLVTFRAALGSIGSITANNCRQANLRFAAGQIEFIVFKLIPPAVCVTESLARDDFALRMELNGINMSSSKSPGNLFLPLLLDAITINATGSFPSFLIVRSSRDTYFLNLLSLHCELPTRIYNYTLVRITSRGTVFIP